MYCKNFWKRIFPFITAFWLGLLINGWLASDNSFLEEVTNKPFLEGKNVSEKENQKVNLPSGKKNCVSADGHLKYKLLSDGRNQTGNADNVKVKAELIAETKSPKEIRIKKRIEEIEKQLKSLKKISPKNLLYLEKCFDSDGRKPSPKTHH